MPGPGRPPRGVKMKPQVKDPGKQLMRVFKYVFKDYKFHCIAVFVMIIVGVLCNVQGTLFTRSLIDDYITPFVLADTPDFTPLRNAILRVACFYAMGIIANYTQNRIMALVTQNATTITSETAALLCSRNGSRKLTSLRRAANGKDLVTLISLKATVLSALNRTSE